HGHHFPRSHVLCAASWARRPGRPAARPGSARGALRGARRAPRALGRHGTSRLLGGGGGEPRNGGDANAIAGAPRGRTGSDRFEPSEARQTERPAAIAREMGRQAASTSGGTGLDLQPATAKDGRSLELLRPPGNESGEGWEER